MSFERTVVLRYCVKCGRDVGSTAYYCDSYGAPLHQTPILIGNLNIAIGCGGTRKHAAMKESELALGFAYSIANELAEASLTIARYEQLEEQRPGRWTPS